MKAHFIFRLLKTLLPRLAPGQLQRLPKLEAGGAILSSIIFLSDFFRKGFACIKHRVGRVLNIFQRWCQAAAANRDHRRLGGKMDEGLSPLCGAKEGQSQELLRALSTVTKHPMASRKHRMPLFLVHQAQRGPAIKDTGLVPVWSHFTILPPPWLGCVTPSRLYALSVSQPQNTDCATDLHFNTGLGSKVSWIPCRVQNTLEKCLKSP